jgi:hypothetical protein
MKIRRIAIAILCCAAVACGAAPATTSAAAEARARAMLANAEQLFNDGDYAAARGAVDACVAEYVATKADYPTEVITRFYVLDESLRRALGLNLDVELGDPASIPPFVQERFTALKAKELARYARSARRSAMGLTTALVLDTAALEDLSLLQAGFSYSYNLSDAVSLDAGVRFPLQPAFWESIRGQLGLLWYPSFRVERICTGVSFYYMFGLDEFTTYTHSLSFGGRVDFLFRSGFGIGGNAELVRADLVLGSSASPQAPTYTELPLGGLARIVFSNITLYAYYAF